MTTNNTALQHCCDINSNGCNIVPTLQCCLTRPQSSLLRKERSARGDGKEERGREKRLADPESKSCAKSRKVVRGRFCDFFRCSCIYYGQLAYLTYFFFHRSVLL